MLNLREREKERQTQRERESTDKELVEKKNNIVLHSFYIA